MGKTNESNNDLALREARFDWYSNQLGLCFPELKGQYLCPYCLQLFSKDDLHAKPEPKLTKAHIIPEAIGGRDWVLACKDCNSNLGTNLDNLIAKNFSQKKFLNGEEKKPKPGRMKIDEYDIGVQISLRKENGNISPHFEFDPRTSNSKIFNEAQLRFIEKALTGKGEPVLYEQKYKEPSKRLLEIGVLNIAYLDSFKYLSYPYILSEPLTIIRNQIINPYRQIITNPFALYDIGFDKPNIRDDRGLKIFYESLFGPGFVYHMDEMSVFLPFTNDTSLTIYSELKKSIEFLEKSNVGTLVRGTQTLSDFDSLKIFLKEIPPYTMRHKGKNIVFEMVGEEYKDYLDVIKASKPINWKMVKLDSLNYK